jgi:hypothetical protein
MGSSSLTCTWIDRRAAPVTLELGGTTMKNVKKRFAAAAMTGALLLVMGPVTASAAPIECAGNQTPVKQSGGSWSCENSKGTKTGGCTTKGNNNKC